MYFKFLSLFCNYCTYNENSFIISKYDVVQHICWNIRKGCFFVQIIIFKLCLLTCEKNHTILFPIFFLKDISIKYLLKLYLIKRYFNRLIYKWNNMKCYLFFFLNLICSFVNKMHLIKIIRPSLVKFRINFSQLQNWLLKEMRIVKFWQLVSTYVYLNWFVEVRLLFIANKLMPRIDLDF